MTRIIRIEETACCDVWRNDDVDDVVVVKAGPPVWNVVYRASVPGVKYEDCRTLCVCTDRMYDRGKTAKEAFSLFLVCIAPLRTSCLGLYFYELCYLDERGSGFPLLSGFAKNQVCFPCDRSHRRNSLVLLPRSLIYMQEKLG